MEQRKRITTKNFVVNSSKEPGKDFVWFVRHAKLNRGLAMIVKRGSLEHTLTKLRKEVM